MTMMVAVLQRALSSILNRLRLCSSQPDLFVRRTLALGAIAGAVRFGLERHKIEPALADEILVLVEEAMSGPCLRCGVRPQIAGCVWCAECDVESVERIRRSGG